MLSNQQTILVPTSWGQILPPNPSRKNLLIGSTGANTQYIFFGAAPPTVGGAQFGLRLDGGPPYITMLRREEIGELITASVWAFASAANTVVYVLEGMY